MSETAAEARIEPPPVVLEIAPTHEPASPTLEAAAELHTAPPEGEAPAPAERALPEIEHAIGTTRQAVLDHFLDSEGDQSMSQIKAALANVLPGTVEAAVRREYEAGRLLRVAPGVYRLAPKPPEPPKAAPPTESPKIREDGRTTEQWFALLEAWDADPSSWNVERNGAPPGTPDHRIPWDIAMRFADRLRKRQERRRERDEADAKLRNQLLAACAGNYSPGPGLNDLAPIRLAMQVVPLDSILSSIRGKTDKKLYPGNEPATSWRSERLLRAIAQDYCRFTVVPSMVLAWSAAGTAPGKPADASSASPAVRIPAEQENAPLPDSGRPSALATGFLAVWWGRRRRMMTCRHFEGKEHERCR